jgi:hypothetical protein
MFHYSLSYWLGLSPPSFPFIPLFPILNGINRFQCFIFIQIYKVHQPYSPSFNLPIHPPTSIYLLTRPIFSVNITVDIHCSKEFCHGISHVNILYFNQFNTFCYSSLTFPTLYYSTASSAFIMPSSYTHVNYFNIIHSLSFSFFLPLVPSNSSIIANIFCVCVCMCYVWVCVYQTDDR